jgi:thymidine phosphorylase
MRDVFPGRAGIVTRIDARAVGIAVVALGGGRTRAEDRIDPAVGFSALAGLGAEVSPVMPIGRAHARSEEAGGGALTHLLAAYTIGPEAPAAVDPVIARIARRDAER